MDEEVGGGSPPRRKALLKGRRAVAFGGRRARPMSGDFLLITAKRIISVSLECEIRIARAWRICKSPFAWGE